MKKVATVLFMVIVILSLVSCSIFDDSLEHQHISNDGWIIKKSPTCTEEGLRVLKCSQCGETFSQDVIQPTGHTEGEWVIDIEPTCTTDGRKHTACTVCTEVLQDETISANGHSFSDWETTIEPTIKTTGLECRTCSVCEFKEENIIAELPHTHQYSNELSSDNESHWYECDCGEKSGEVAHSFDQWIIDKETTCTENGSRHYICSICEKYVSEIIESKGHTVVTDKGFPATCLEDGLSDRQHCSVCKIVLKEQSVITAKGHSTVNDSAVKETCTTSGLTSGQHCKNCNTVFVEQQVIQATGHNYVNGKCTKCKVETKIGDYITLGHYEQDNSLANDKESIEWLVLYVDNDKALVISKYVLDCQCYNDVYEAVSWENCSIRTWLNGTFFDTSFSEAEKNKILDTTVSTPANQSTGASGGNDTIDKLFLLSKDEVKIYFQTVSDRASGTTDYAKMQGCNERNIYTSYNWKDGKIVSTWWLRYPEQKYGVYIDLSGKFFEGAFPDKGRGIRPAMWISLN